jgi:hypothetical protein
MPINEYRRKVKKQGITITKGKGSHIKLVRIDRGIKKMYPVTVHDKQVLPVYVEATKKRFGISDSNWKNA